jgi:cytochrome c5
MKINSMFLVLSFVILIVACSKKSTQTAIAKKEPAPEAKPANVSKTDSAYAVNKKTEPIQTQATPVTIPAVEKPIVNTPAVNMDNGKQVYYVKCAKCHQAKAPDLYTADRWIKIVDWMGPRAKITELEKENILAYVKAFAKK